MKKIHTFFVLLLPWVLSVQEVRSENPHGINEEHVQRFRLLQTALENNAPAEIAEFFSLPYRLPHPVPPIQTVTEFGERIGEVLDDTVRTRLMNAEAEKDLAVMGWRGVLFDHGLVWFRENDFRIFAINHHTDAVLEKRAGLIERMKEELHPSARTFHLPILEQETYSYRFRIDQLVEESYQLVMWPWNKSYRDEPRLVLTSGRIEYFGSGGNHTYTFENNGDVYEVNIHIVGTRTTPPGELVVHQAGEEIFRQPFPIVFHSDSYRVWIEYPPTNGVRLHLWGREKNTAEQPDVYIPDGKITYTDDPEGNLYLFRLGDRQYEVRNPFDVEGTRHPKTLRIFDETGDILLEELRHQP